MANIILVKLSRCIASTGCFDKYTDEMRMCFAELLEFCSSCRQRSRWICLESNLVTSVKLVIDLVLMYKYFAIVFALIGKYFCIFFFVCVGVCVCVCTVLWPCLIRCSKMSSYSVLLHSKTPITSVTTLHWLHGDWTVTAWSWSLLPAVSSSDYTMPNRWLMKYEFCCVIDDPFSVYIETLCDQLLNSTISVKLIYVHTRKQNSACSLA